MVLRCGSPWFQAMIEGSIKHGLSAAAEDAKPDLLAEVLRCPDEPPLGTTVESIEKDLRWESQASPSRTGPWFQVDAPTPTGMQWRWVLFHAGASGVRVVTPEELRRESVHRGTA